MEDKASSFVDKGLRNLFDKLGIVHEEIHVRDGKSSLLLAFKKQYVDYDALQQLRDHLKPKEMRIYPQRYSHFADQDIDHTGVIICIDNEN